MRVHRLRIEAFGPFPGTVDLDLDALSAEGLFLIHGPTGAGKTSLLEAICFALYADVPGARSKKGLRSDHAPQGAVPEVTLEFTSGDRRLRIVRSPEFTRPKKRGTGQLTVHAKVTLEERLGTHWVVRGSRHDEVADIVKDALGMGMAQFSSVVLLPQGDFATFLRASPDDRRAVLERLFDITEYRDVEDWLAEARRAARADLDRARGVLGSELGRVHDVIVDAGLVAESPTSEHTEDDDIGAGPTKTPSTTSGLTDLPPEDVADALTDLLDLLDARVSSTMAAYDHAVSADTRATEALERGRAIADLRARGERARRELDELDALGEEHTRRAVTVAAAERAAGLDGHLTAGARARTDLRDAVRHADACRSACAALSLVVPSDGDVAVVVAALLAQDVVVLELHREAQEARSRGRRAADLRARSCALEAEQAEVLATLERAEQTARDLDTDVGALAVQAATVPALTLRLASARESLHRLDSSDAALARVAELVPARDAARSVALDRRQDLLDLRARRLDQMAGELAASLLDGGPCPVCGSQDHPEPARSTDAVRPEDIAAAETLLDVADQAYRALHDETQAHHHTAETLRATLGDADRDSLERSVLDLAAELGAAQDHAARHGVAAARHRLQLAQVDTTQRRSTSLLAQLASIDEQLSQVAAEEMSGQSHLDALTTAHRACPCGGTDPGGHSVAGRALVELQGAVDDVFSARQRAESAESDLQAAVSDAGFDSAEEALRHALSRDVLARERSLLTAHRDRVAAAQAVTNDADVAAALGDRAPDLPTLLESAHTARESLLGAGTGFHEAERTRRALQRLVPTVTAASSALTAATARDTRVREVADTAGGTGPENTLRMRLTSFVLAARLEKIATLANERLSVMGGGRYLLEHSDDLAARGARSGLGLRVLDQWTGAARDTATLSGGESFMASLALAFGLADAVREEAGGFDLGTLFIDEGFGTLDDDSLEQVVTVLDSLREGGRAVGVVSHVADLRTRISHQAVVHKGAAGSTVEVRTGVSAEPAA